MYHSENDNKRFLAPDKVEIFQCVRELAYINFTVGSKIFYSPLNLDCKLSALDFLAGPPELLAGDIFLVGGGL